MPAQVEHAPLRVVFTFSNGGGHTVRFTELPLPGLVEQLAVGLANLAHPHGGLDSTGSAKEYRVRIGQLVRWLDHAGFTGEATDLAPAQMIGF